MNYIFCTNCGSRLTFPDAPCQRCPTIHDFKLPETTQIFAPELETVVRQKTRTAKRPTATPPKAAMPAHATKPKKNDVWYDIGKFIGSVILTAGCVVFGLTVLVGAARLVKIDGTLNANTSIPIQSSTPNQKTTIIDNTSHVPASRGLWYKFTLNKISRVTGTFSVQGGMNEIECLVMSEIEYIKWENNNTSLSYFNSGFIKTGNIDLNLPAGNYVLVFYNRAVFEGKFITAKVEIE